MYLAGFGNHHQSEAIPGALPKEQNSPQHCQFGLYAEQLSGTAFTRPRHVNSHSWLYRTIPSVVHEDYQPYEHAATANYAKLQAPNPFRWSPFEAPTDNRDFVDSLFHIAGNQSTNAYLYQCSQSMQTRYFSNYDGEMLLVPYLGEIILYTEFGRLAIAPGKIAVIPRGVKFKVELICPLACGYLCENAGTPLGLPPLGPLGANSLANPRHFLYPQASYENYNDETTLICKYQQQFWVAKSNHSPLNVVAWHGNYAPYIYDLSLFNTINTVSFDHPDPSIFTVLTSESEIVGVANLDFVIFPPRWMVAEHTFRPPYFHRNVMNEFMGLIHGEYDAKTEGFLPGGISIHNCMTAHGPDTETYQKTIQEELVPTRYQNTLAFMFETKAPWLISKKALAHPSRQLDYTACWQGLGAASTNVP
ncbi:MULTISPECIES: homogentisate 1,2-dioxygenase [unclassified Legionella]|uniref:homogentisate 1,2-dioxygenase n=1 Tax=unclassified Legionella TaxID=2622702 RepID=UPI001E60D2DF|nr:homogentisate 1,2-dioxygenase [Legionella sp. 31fI33]